MRIFLRKIRSTMVASVYTNPENAIAIPSVTFSGDKRFIGYRSRRSEPSGQGVGEPPLGQVPHPRYVSVGPNQDGGRSGDYPECWKLPRTDALAVDQLNAIRPWTEVEAAGLMAHSLVDRY
jgi:hypothetical protein